MWGDGVVEDKTRGEGGQQDGGDLLGDPFIRVREVGTSRLDCTAGSEWVHIWVSSVWR